MKRKPVHQYFIVHWYKDNWRIRWFGMTAQTANAAFTDLSLIYRKGDLRLFKGELRKIRNGGQ